MKSGMATQAVLPADTAPLTVASVREIDAQIVDELQKIRTGKLSERRGEIVVSALLKMRDKAPDLTPSTSAGGVTFGWSIPFCVRCTCSTCSKVRADRAQRATTLNGNGTNGETHEHREL